MMKYVKEARDMSEEYMDSVLFILSTFMYDFLPCRCSSSIRTCLNLHRSCCPLLSLLLLFLFGLFVKPTFLFCLSVSSFLFCFFHVLLHLRNSSISHHSSLLNIRCFIFFFSFLEERIKLLDAFAFAENLSVRIFPHFHFRHAYFIDILNYIFFCFLKQLLLFNLLLELSHLQNFSHCGCSELFALLRVFFGKQGDVFPRRREIVDIC